eukprot:m.76723 g.76723  ORF g.76723 m.76723 type:complete len:346 (+) comp12574_c0_seq3:162-1199(+)
MSGRVFCALLCIATQLSCVVTSSKQLRWYIGDPIRVAPLLNGSNPDQWLNTSLSVSEFTGGIYQCCNGFVLQADGTIRPFSQNGSGWDKIYPPAQVDMFVSLSLQQNCSATGTPSGCWSASDTCNAALSRVDNFTQEVLELIHAYNLKGINLDWEFGYGCNMTCHELLWSQVMKVLHSAGKQLAISVDDSQGNNFNKASTSWSYEWDWKYFLPYTDILINMGTYPGAWSKGISWPASQYLKPYKCPHNSSRTCGVEGQVEDMINLGVSPESQLQPGIWLDACQTVNGTTQTMQGWTQEALHDFLNFLDEKNVKIITIWTDDALLIPKQVTTCPWFVEELRNWAAN